MAKLPGVRSIRLRDFVDLALVTGLLPISWLTPERSWPSITQLLARLHVRLGRANPSHLAEPLTGHFDRLSPAELELGFRRENFMELLELLREYRPGGWRPEIRVHGAEHLDEALASGSRIVLWVWPAAHNDLVTKKGLHEHGYAVAHLSHFTHGFSDTRFGLLVLNRIKTVVEDRYLRERCQMRPEGAGPAIRRLIVILNEPGIVSITALHTGRKTSQHSFFGGELKLANGAPNVALSNGAVLIPVFTLRTGPGRFEVHVETPLEAGDAAVMPAQEEALAERYAEIMERYVRRAPEVWRGWFGSARYWRPAM